MYPRVNYALTQADLDAALEACKPIPMIMLHIGGGPGRPQERANDAWRALGEKMGFDYMTVQPCPEKGQRFFTAVPSETEQARKERKAQEKVKKRSERVGILRLEIAARQEELRVLSPGDSL